MKRKRRSAAKVAAALLGARGGKRRAKVLTAARRSEIASLGNVIRWRGKTLTQRQAATAKARGAKKKNAKKGAKSHA